MVMPMIDVLIDDDITFEPPENIEAAVLSACANAGFTTTQDIDLCVRFGSDRTIQSLNQQWRDKDKVTDVLSFPMQVAPFDLSESLGDIALAVPFIIHEATRLNVSAVNHCLHLIIHATLHLLGFDHIDDNDALRMQKLEQQTMHALALHNPYPELGNIKVASMEAP